MVINFLFVATQVASWVVVVSYPTEMSFKLYVCSAQAEYDDLVLYLKKVDGIFCLALTCTFLELYTVFVADILFDAVFRK